MLNFNNYKSDFTRFSKKKDGDLKGKYYILVYGLSYGTYSIMYYTDSKTDINQISSIPLNNREIIKDYLNLDISHYKVYSYLTNYEKNKEEDVRIILTPIIGDFELYVYFSTDKIKYNNKTNTFSDYEWSTVDTFSDNYIIINKNDKHYKARGEYFIIVALLENKFYNETSFYLGVTDETNGINIQENIPIVSSLNIHDYKSQEFRIALYEEGPISVDLNVYSGMINFKVVFPISNLLYGEENCDKDCTILLNKEIIKQKKENGLVFDIKIILTDVSDNNSFFSLSSKYQLIVRPDVSQSIELLYQGLTKHDSVDYKELNYYYAYIPKNEKVLCSIFFTNVDGLVFAKLLTNKKYSKTEIYNQMPKEENPALKFATKLWDASLNLSEKETSTCDDFCILLITVKGETVFDYNSKKPIQYDISLSNKVTEIAVNKSITRSILSGEYAFFRVNISPGVNEIENIIFSISNSEGDVDLFINYGEDLPSIEKNNYNSISNLSEIIEISKEDSFFVERNITSLEGIYTIALFSYTNSTFTLNISPFKNKIFDVNDYYPSQCKEKKDNNCYFKYSLDYLSDMLVFNDTNINVDTFYALIYINFHYGTGEATAKLVTKVEGNISNMFPSRSNIGQKGIFSNNFDRNYIQLIIKKADYPELFELSTGHSFKKPLVPLAFINVKCTMDCFFSIQTALQSRDKEYYLDSYYDNLIYLPSNFEKNIFYFNYNSDKVYDLQVELIKGKTTFDSTVSKSDKSGEVIKESFTLDDKTKQTTIKVSKSGYNKASIVAKSYKNESIFFIKALVHEEWIKLQAGSDNIISPNYQSHNINAFFDIPNEYESVIINIQCKKIEYCNISAYGKFDMFVLSSDIKYNFDPVTTSTNDYYEKTDDSLIKNLKMKIKVPKLKEKEKIIFKLLLNYDNKLGADNDITISISPKMKDNNTSLIYLEAGKPFLSEFHGSITGISFTGHDVYEISKSTITDNRVKIYISNCIGLVDFKIYDNPYFEIGNKEDEIKSYINKLTDKGKTTIEIKDVKSNIYIAVFPLSYGNAKESSGKSIDNSKDNILSSYSISYNSDFVNLTDGPSNHNLIKYNIEEKTIKFEKYITNDNIKYILYYSKEESSYSILESVCIMTNTILSSHNKISFIEIEPIVNLKTSLLEYKIENPSGDYYVNIGVKTDKGEIFSYNAIQISIQDKSSLIIPIFIILGLIVLVSIIFYMYFKTRRRLELERTDITNMANTNRYKTDKELQEMKEQKELGNVKYTNLSEAGVEI